MTADRAARPPGDREGDAYLSYLHRFFDIWLPVYDWFARSIFWAYRKTVACLGLQPGMKVLDICTGTGEIALRCARLGADVTGVDVTPAMLEKARVKAGGDQRTRDVRFEIMDARRLKYADASFDVGVLSFALHDMPRKVRVEVLAEAARVVAKRLVILDYDLPRRPRLRRAAGALIALFETAYFRSFSREGVVPLLEESGVVKRSGGKEHVLTVTRIFPHLFSVYRIDFTEVRPARPSGTE
jgi:ubiquinone/menaquinone biosynthesis C-methylase UbiE